MKRGISKIPDICSGAEDPGDQCPRHPSECVCWMFEHEERMEIFDGKGQDLRARLQRQMARVKLMAEEGKL